MSEKNAVATHRFPRLAAGDDAAAAGYAAGYAAGMRAAAARDAARDADARHRLDAAIAHDRARIDAAAHALERAALAVERRAADEWEATAARVVDAAIELAALIIGDSGLDAATLASAAARRVLEHPDADTLTAVRMHPDDLALVAELVAARADVAFIGDPELAAGDAVGIVPDAVIDARLAQAIERCRSAVGERS